MSSGGGPNGDNDSDSGISVDSYTKALKIDVGGGNAATGATAASLPPPPPPPPHVGTSSAAAAATGRQFNSINIMEQFLNILGDFGMIFHSETHFDAKIWKFHP